MYFQTSSNLISLCLTALNDFSPFNLASSKYIIYIQTSCDKEFHGLTLDWMKKYLLVF